MPEPTKVRSLRLPVPLWEAIDDEAAKQHRSANNIVSVALAMMFDPNVPEPLWDEVERRLAAGDE